MRWKARCETCGWTDYIYTVPGVHSALQKLALKQEVEIVHDMTIDCEDTQIELTVDEPKAASANVP